MKKIRSAGKLLLVLLVAALPLGAQPGPDLTTVGDQSPVVVGANATIRYQNTQRVDRRQIPESVVPLLAGLLLTNDVADQAREQAILRWIDHYDELSKRINLVVEADRRNRLLNWLNKGDLMRIDRDLGQATDGHALAGVFPAQFARNLTTNGNQSPLIYGDGATVAYVVEQVITYQLPEKISLNLLRQIEAAKAGNAALSNSLEKERKLVREWIAKYRAIAEELKQTPGAIAERAYALFSEGKFSEAVDELHQLEGAMDQVARSAILSARIALLQPIAQRSDAVVESIRRDFARAVALRDSLNDHLQYADFLTNVLNDHQTALNILNKARPLAATRTENIKLASAFCRIAFARADHQSLREYATFGLRNLDLQPPGLSRQEQLTYRYRFLNDMSFAVYLAAQQLTNAENTRELTDIERNQQQWLSGKMKEFDDGIDRLADTISREYPTDSIQYYSEAMTRAGNKVLHAALNAPAAEGTGAFDDLILRGRNVTNRHPEAWFPHYFNLKNFFNHTLYQLADYKKAGRITDEILAIQRQQSNRRAIGGYPQEIHPWLMTRMQLALLNNDFATAEAAIDTAFTELERFVDENTPVPPYANLYWQLTREQQVAVNALKSEVYSDPEELKEILDRRLSQFSVPPQELQGYLTTLSNLARVYLRHLVETHQFDAAREQLIETNAHIMVFSNDHPGGKIFLDVHQLNLFMDVSGALLKKGYVKDAADVFTEARNLVPDTRSETNPVNTGMVLPYRLQQIAILYALDAVKEARERVELLEGELNYNENFNAWNNAAPLYLARVYALALSEETRLGNKKAATEFYEKLVVAERTVAEGYKELTMLRNGWDYLSVLNVRRQRALNLFTKASYLARYGDKKDWPCRALRQMAKEGRKLVGDRHDRQLSAASEDARLALAAFRKCRER